MISLWLNVTAILRRVKTTLEDLIKSVKNHCPVHSCRRLCRASVVTVEDRPGALPAAAGQPGVAWQPAGSKKQPEVFLSIDGKKFPNKKHVILLHYIQQQSGTQ